MPKFRPFRQTEDIALDITPIIDMVFILLIFFMLTSAFSQNHQLNINLPEASSTKPQVNNRTIEVMLSASSQISVAGIALADNKPDTVRQAFLPYLSKLDSTVIISADAQAPYQAMVTILDITGQLGFANIRLNTKQKDESKR